MNYKDAHIAVRNLHGPARAHACAACGRRAAHWAYQHTDPHRLVDAEGRLFSASPEHYRAMCRACHLNLDSSMTYRHVLALLLNRRCATCLADLGEFCRSPSGNRIYTGPTGQHAPRLAGFNLYEMLPHSPKLLVHEAAH